MPEEQIAKKPGQRVAYLRVSTRKQNLDRQEDLAATATKVFREKESGKNLRDRPVLAECLSYLREGDTLVVWDMSRLGRSMIDLHLTIDSLTERGVSVEFVKENLKFGDAKAGAIQNLMKNILASYAEFEREMALERQAEGIAKARAKKTYKGRKPVLNRTQVADVQAQLANEKPKAKIARDLGVSRAVILAVSKNDYEPIEDWTERVNAEAA